MTLSVLSVVSCCLYLALALQICGANSCELQGNVPQFQNTVFDEDDGAFNRITVHRQAIMPSYKFSCLQDTCGNITEWGVDLYPTTRAYQGVYTLDLQVWRPSPTVDDSSGVGCYSLVGNNRFSSISLSSGVAILTPSPQNYIEFRDRDVLGVYVEEARETFNGVVLVNPVNFGAPPLWLGSVNPTRASSQSVHYTAGSNGDLNTFLRAAPVISIQTETFSCTPPPVMVTSTNTPMPSATAFDDCTAMPFATDAPTTEIETEDNIVTFTGNTNANTNDSSAQNSSAFEISFELILGTTVAGFVTLILLLTMVAIITIIVKKRRKKMKGFSVVDQGAAFSNQVYMNPDATGELDITYEYVESPTKPLTKSKISVKYDTTTEKISTDPPLTHKSEVQNTHISYHDVGPDASTPPELPARVKVGAQVHEQNREGNEYHYVETKSAKDDNMNSIKKEPLTISNSCGLQGAEGSDIFDTAGIYVPTLEQRATWEGHYEMQETNMYHKLKFFNEDKIYWAPASTTSDLYIQLASNKYREIPRNQITISSRLGSGQFGEVCKAQWSVSGTTKAIAIKTLKTGSKEEEKVKFLQEAAIMGQFYHHNVVRLYGVVTVGDPVMICLELMANGDLREYLTTNMNTNNDSGEVEIQFLRFSKQIAAGMNYLANKSFIHRDLAARNILLDESLICKVGDFGMARDLMDDTYYTATGGAKIPIKWTSPEALLYKKYSTDSDVWSYGMVLFEIWSVGKKPFSMFTNSEVVRQINTGYNQPPPPGCPRAIYKLMVDCWHPEHSKRPSFSDIVHYLSASKDLLLQWVEATDEYPSGVRKLGASLTVSLSLYKDLQNAYTSTQ